MKALDLLGFFPDRNISGALYQKLKGTSELKKINGAIYAQLKKGGSTGYVPSEYLKKGRERQAVYWYAQHSGGGVVRIPFPPSQVETVRKALIAAAEKERDRLETQIREQRKALATKQGLDDLIGRLETSWEVSLLRDPKNPAALMAPFVSWAPVLPKTEVPEAYWRGYGGVPRVDYVDAPAGSLRGAQLGCYLSGLYWRQRARQLGRPLSEDDQRTLFSPPLTLADMKKSAKLIDDLVATEQQQRRWAARQPQMRALPDDYRFPSESGSGSHGGSQFPELMPRLMRSNSFARDLRGRYERETRPFEMNEIDFEMEMVP
jgi:hypothetical protein